MLSSVWIALLLGFWSTLYLIDVFLKVNCLTLNTTTGNKQMEHGIQQV